MGQAKGQLQELKDGKRGKSGRRGQANTARRLDAFKNGGGAGSASWATCHSELLLGVVVGITRLGGAVTLGLSRDLGAHSLTLLLDDNRTTLWFNGDANLDEKLQEVIQTLAAM